MDTNAKIIITQWDSYAIYFVTHEKDKGYKYLQMCVFV